MKYGHLANAVFNTPWAIQEEMFETITSILRYRMEGGTLSAEEIKARIGAQDADAAPREVDKIAILPLFGVISQRMNLMTAVSGGTSTEMFGARFRAAVVDPSVAAIVIEIDSPGGSISGLEELATDIYNARGSKPIIAVANPMMASAAYWIGSAADKIYVAPGGSAGSIGVIAHHADFSKAEERAGIKTTIVTSSRYKGEGHPSKPLSGSATKYMQEVVDDVDATFVGMVARQRGVDEEAVRRDFGQGRMLMGRQAVEAGMADGVKTLREVLEQLGASLDPAEPAPPETPDINPADLAESAANKPWSEPKATSKKEEPEVNELEAQVRQALGLGADDDIVAAIGQLKTAAKDIATGDRGAENQLRRENAELRERILTSEVEMKQKVISLEEQSRQREAKYAVDTAIQQGRVAPKDREVALKLALNDPEAFAAFAADLKVDLKERGIATDAMLADLEPTAEEMKTAASMGVTREDLMKQKAKDKGVALPV